jgi:hypothetical protein
MTLEQTIEEFVKSLHIPSVRQRNSVLKQLIKFFEKHPHLKNNMHYIRNNTNQFLNATVNGIQSYRRDKNSLNKNIRDFMLFLRTHHQIMIDVDTFFPPLKYKEKSERMIEILKYLQEQPKTRGEIAQHFGISERALNDDLNELQSGSYSFRGYNMKINLRRGDNTYDSTIHPVFLPLNLSEVYALTIGLKMTGQGTVFEDIYSYIADSIFDQLSPYGQRRIGEKAKETNVYLSSDHNKTYRFEEDLLNEKLQQQRRYLFSYYLKSGAPCEIEYDTSVGIKTVTGRVEYAKDDDRGYLINRIKVINEGQAGVEIDIDKVVTIRLV